MESKKENTHKPVKLMEVSEDILALFTPNILKKEDGEGPKGETKERTKFAKSKFCLLNCFTEAQLRL